MTKGNPVITDEKAKAILDSGEKKKINPWDSKFCRVPSRHLLVGASETGKSFAVCRFLLHEKNPYVYPYGKTIFLIHPSSKDQPKLKNTQEYLNNFAMNDPDGVGHTYEPFQILVSRSINNEVGIIMDAVEDCAQKKLNFMLIIDDAYGTDTTKSNFLVELYVKGRHKNISVMFLTQVAMSNKIMKDIRRNINYLWVFQSYQEDIDALLAQIISKRYPEKREEFYNNYLKVLEKDYGYMVFSPFIAENQYRFNTFFPEGAKPKSDAQIAKERAEADVPDKEEKEVKRTVAKKTANPFERPIGDRLPDRFDLAFKDLFRGKH